MFFRTGWWSHGSVLFDPHAVKKRSVDGEEHVISKRAAKKKPRKVAKKPAPM